LESGATDERRLRRVSHLVPALALLAVSAAAQQPRARDLGIPFDFGEPGEHDAITDVPGVEVGHVTLVEGDSVRTGVTAVLPRGRGEAARDQCFGGYFSLNGNGEMTGLPWVKESGLVEGPILITNTNAVGVVRDAVIDHAFRRWGPVGLWSLPIVAETWDGPLNDIYGGHVKAGHAHQAIEAARGGAVAEGAVGGGTGMVCYEFKGGIGTASRRLPAADGGHHVGVLVQANFGLRHQLRIAGVPVGTELPREKPLRTADAGSIIVVVATDAPLLPHQLERLARRSAMGVARTGSVAGNGSGDLMIAFSTANPRVGDPSGEIALRMLPNAEMGGLFEATVGATEEAIVNALVAGRDMHGYQGSFVEGLPLERVREVLRRYNRLEDAEGR